MYYAYTVLHCGLASRTCELLVEWRDVLTLFHISYGLTFLQANYFVSISTTFNFYPWYPNLAELKIILCYQVYPLICRKIELENVGPQILSKLDESICLWCIDKI